MSGTARAIIAEIFSHEGIDTDAAAPLAQVYATITQSIVARARDDTPLIVGICGAQGSGKSTLARVLQALLEHAGLPTAQFSLDDLYLTRKARQQLAEATHPLLRTRGVPGTHDVALGLSTLQALATATAGSSTAIPSFDKATDDRLPQSQWPQFQGPARVILLEGWCVGARPQHPEALAQPINALERDEDPDGVWRGIVNARLAAEYQPLFGHIDLLILLRAPSFETVFGWRKQQEDQLRDRLCVAGPDREPAGVMDDAQLCRFIRHYERITRHILTEMPERADICLTLDTDRSVSGVICRT